MTEIFVGAVLLAVAGVAISWAESSDESDITEKLKSFGATLISVDSPRRVVSAGTPFLMIARGERAYRFTYLQNKKVKIGWVKFGFFNDWRLDYKPSC